MQQANIFVIESQPNLSRTLESCVESNCLNNGEGPDKNYQIMAFNTVRESFRKFKELYGELNFSNIDNALVFVDLFLEDRDGLSLIENIRNDYHGLNIIAFLPENSIIQGALENLELRNQAEAAGANAVLIAPFNLHEIVSTVRRLAEEAPAPVTTQVEEAQGQSSVA